MHTAKKTLEWVTVAALAIVCCGLPLLVAGAISIEAAAWVGGGLAAALVAAAAVAALAGRGRRRGAGGR